MFAEIGQLLLFDNAFEDNEASMTGGALFAAGLELEFSHLFFGNNFAARDGGALSLTSITSSSVIDVTKTQQHMNTSQKYR